MVMCLLVVCGWWVSWVIVSFATVFVSLLYELVGRVRFVVV